MNSETKNVILVISYAVLLALCYKLAISKTLEYRKSYIELQKEQLVYKDTPEKLSLLKIKEHYFDSILMRNNLKLSSFQNNLLKTISSISDTTYLKVVNFEEPHITTQNDMVVKTYEFIIEGGYNNILNLIYQLELKGNFGEVINLNIEKKKNYRTNKEYLETKVLLKSYN